MLIALAMTVSCAAPVLALGVLVTNEEDIGAEGIAVLVEQLARNPARESIARFLDLPSTVPGRNFLTRRDGPIAIRRGVTRLPSRR